ncbi:MAG: thiosulfate oxidation carrier protein SoxY [Hyphomicrobiales bacterium]|nr:thiosulfate oxidation carrier protein SoxY [Hyphomicrobiales bacterium]
MVSPINKNVGRRGVLKTAGLGFLAAAGGSMLATSASATPETAAKALAKMTGGAAMTEGKVKLELPQIAENGRTVPLKVTVDSPMTDDNYVKHIHIVAEGNPTPEMISFNLTPGAGKAELSTRVRLGKTQNIVAAAVMSDGSVFTAKEQVKVTIGGCGG